MTDYTTRVEYDDIDEIARKKLEEQGVTEDDVESVTKRICYACEIAEYDVRRKSTPTHAFATDEIGQDPNFACIYDDGLKVNYLVNANGDEYLCEECLHEVMERGSPIVGIDPQGNRVAIRHLWGVISHVWHWSEWNTDNYDLEDFPATDSIEAIVAEEEPIPFTASGLYATNTPKGEREITGEKMVDAFDRDFPYNVPSDYQTRDSFVDALRTGEVYAPTVAITVSSSVFVPEDDAEMMFNVYRDWVDSDSPSSTTA